MGEETEVRNLKNCEMTSKPKDPNSSKLRQFNDKFRAVSKHFCRLQNSANSTTNKTFQYNL